jgi:modulator of FtsH protease HflK
VSEPDLSPIVYNNSGNGGPWGNLGGGQNPPGNGGNPWGRGPSSGGTPPGQGPGQGPDLDALLRDAAKIFGKRMTGGGPGKGGGASGRPIAFAALAAVGLWLASGFYIVQPTEQGVVLRFGSPNRTAESGLRYHLPWPFESVLKPQVTRQNRTEIGFRSNGDSRRPGTDRAMPDESFMLTGDENIVDINFTVFWRIRNAPDFLFEIRDPTSTVKAAAESAMREVIGHTEIQKALTGARSEIEEDTKQLLQAMLDDYKSGVEIVQVQLQKVDPPATVVDAFNDVQRARADRERLRNEADAYRNNVVPVAKGEAEKIVQEAMGYREQVIAIAKGEAARFSEVLEAYRLSGDVVAKRLYLETMESILGNSKKVIMDSNGKEGSAVPYLPLGDMLKKSAPAETARPANAAPANTAPTNTPAK